MAGAVGGELVAGAGGRVGVDFGLGFDGFGETPGAGTGIPVSTGSSFSRQPYTRVSRIAMPAEPPRVTERIRT